MFGPVGGVVERAGPVQIDPAAMVTRERGPQGFRKVAGNRAARSGGEAFGVDKRYADYCRVDSLFYDSPLNAPDAPDFEFAGRRLPDGWRRDVMERWTYYRCEAVGPSQGWKIHVSGCPDNAEKLVAVAGEYCLDRGIPFKHLRGLAALVVANGKYGPRGSSGKLVTIYPADEDELRRILRELGERLAGEPGPYILSDLRWGEGPLYVRYGGFARRYCLNEAGQREPAIENPDGELVPDRRTPTFQVPSWVELPDFLAPHLAARNGVTVADLPYEITTALHYSNGGGVYEGTDRRTGESVILKEARPYAGLDSAGVDAVTRLERERRMLERLDGIDAVPALRDYFVLGDHHFLVQDFVPGLPLRKECARRLPIVNGNRDAAGTAAYRDWTAGIIAAVERAVAALHERGVIFGDLHLSNVIVRPDGQVSLIDFEVASLVGEGRRPTLGDPAFAAPRDRTGTAIDRYSLACLRLALFLPLTVLIRLDRAKAAHLAAEITRGYALPDGFLDGAVREITGGVPHPPPALAGTQFAGDGTAPDPAAWEPTRRALTAAILASATPRRDDRLFPGDVEQFHSGGLGLAHGAAGVLYALAESGSGRLPEFEEWLVRRASAPDPLGRLGLYDGLHGVAFVLDRFGYRREALNLIDVCLRERWSGLGNDLFGGLAGIGLNLDHLAVTTGDGALTDAAAEVADLVADRLGDAESVGTLSGGEHAYAGLLRGSAGPALMFLRRYERTGDPGYLDLADTALRQDLRRCTPQDNGSLQVNEGWRTIPYLATGAVGLGLALESYLEHRENEEFADAARRIGLAARSALYVFPGLFNGRAGIILYLARQRSVPRSEVDPVLALQVRNLAWHAIDHGGGLAFPGDHLHRLSMDLATGTAGVLLALATASGRATAGLPLVTT